MARKKKEDKKTEAPEEEVGTFPQISSSCSIKQVTLKKGGQDIRFENFRVSEGQTEILDGLINTGEDVKVTISPIQARLPGM